MNKKDELIDLLRDRLSDAEAHVDPNLWEGIQTRLAEAAIAAGSDPVTQLFRDGLKEAEAPVDPGVWSNISGQLGQGAAAGTSVSTWIGGGVAAAVVAGALWFSSGDEAPPTVPIAQTKEAVQQEVPKIEEPGVQLPVMEGEQRDEPAAIVQEERANSTRTQPATVPAEPMNDTQAAPPSELPATPASVAADVEKEPETKPGPFIQKVEAIMQQAAAEVDKTPQPRVEPDPQIPPPTFAAPATDVSGEHDVPEAEEEPMQIFIPNVFTPNGDGANDRLEITASGLTNVTVSIFSASNDKLVYRAKDLTPWDGRDLGGGLCAEGYYFYAIEATGPDGKPMSKGQVVRLFTR